MRFSQTFYSINNVQDFCLMNLAAIWVKLYTTNINNLSWSCICILDHNSILGTFYTILLYIYTLNDKNKIV